MNDVSAHTREGVSWASWNAVSYVFADAVVGTSAARTPSRNATRIFIVDAPVRSAALGRELRRVVGVAEANRRRRTADGPGGHALRRDRDRDLERADVRILVGARALPGGVQLDRLDIDRDHRARAAVHLLALHPEVEHLARLHRERDL